MKNLVKTFHKYLIVSIGLCCFQISYAQTIQKSDKKLEKETQELLRTAEDQLGENDFASAEASYREAIAKSPENITAKYNMANMYYGKEKASQAEEKYKQAASIAETKAAKHEVFHNLGNTYMKQKKYQEAVAAYKDALRNNPTDDETRYNLALAKKMLEKEQNENEGGGDDDKKDQDKNQEDKNKDKDDKGDQDKDKNEGDKKEDQGGDQKDDQQKEPEKPDDEGKPKDKNDKQDQNGEKQPQEQQPQPGQLSPQQIKNLLEAMNNEEKKVQDKINAQKAKGAKTRTEKDW